MSDNPIPATIETTRVVETSVFTHRAPGTFAEVVHNMTTLGWEVTEEVPQGISLRHPLIEGTTRFIQK